MRRSSERAFLFLFLQAKTSTAVLEVQTRLNSHPWSDMREMKRGPFVRVARKRNDDNRVSSKTGAHQETTRDKGPCDKRAHRETSRRVKRAGQASPWQPAASNNLRTDEAQRNERLCNDVFHKSRPSPGQPRRSIEIPTASYRCS